MLYNSIRKEKEREMTQKIANVITGVSIVSIIPIISAIVYVYMVI